MYGIQSQERRYHYSGIAVPVCWNGGAIPAGIFTKNSPYLATKKIGKNNPKADEIRRTNDLRRRWNVQVDHALKRGAPPESLLTVKSELISKPAYESVRNSEGSKDPDKYDSILVRAVLIITEMCRALSKYGRETWAEAWGQALTKLMDLATEKISGKTIDIKKDTRHRTMER